MSGRLGTRLLRLLCLLMDMDVENRKLAVFPPIHRMGPPGKWLRQKLMSGILQGTPVLLQLQSIRRIQLNKLIMAISFLGEEEFYTLLLTILLWIFCSQLGRMMAFSMSLGFYVSGFLKNFLCLPRPPSPPIVPISHCVDWAMPSHHSVVGVTVPWYVWLYVYMNCDWTTVSLNLLLFAVGIWSFGVMFSRLYLGVHSPADVLVGGIIGCGLLTLWLQVDKLVNLHIHSGHFILLLFAGVLFALSVHPDPYPTTYIISETVICVAAGYGIIVGYYFTYIFKIDSIALFEQDIQLTSSMLIIRAVCRFLIGVCVLVVVKITVKKISIFILKQGLSLCSISCLYVKRRSEVTTEKIHFSPYFQVLDKVRSFITVVMHIKFILTSEKYS